MYISIMGWQCRWRLYHFIMPTSQNEAQGSLQERKRGVEYLPLAVKCYSLDMHMLLQLKYHWTKVVA